MAHEARTAALREFFTPLVEALGYKFTPDTELADFLLEQEAVLEENDIPFEAVDIDLLPDDESDRLADEALFASGSHAYPVVRIGDQVIVGYAPEKYARLLGIEG